ncbi:MAG: hypothetical protein ACYC44_04845 [Patescibacteria group bacterium]
MKTGNTMPKPGGCLMNSLRISAFMVVACLTVLLVACSGSDGDPATSSGQGGGQAVSTDKGCGDKPNACISYDYNPDGKLAKVTVDGACGGQGAEANGECWTLTYTAEGKLASVAYDEYCDGAKLETFELGAEGCPLTRTITVGSDEYNWSYECDPAGNVVGQKSWLNNQQPTCLTFSYDDHGNGNKVETSKNCDGTVGSWMHWSYVYDASGRVLSEEMVSSIMKDPPPAPEVAGDPECGTYEYATDGTLLALHWYDECPKTKENCYSYTKPPRGKCRFLPAFHDLVLCQ